MPDPLLDPPRLAEARLEDQPQGSRFVPRAGLVRLEPGQGTFACLGIRWVGLFDKGQRQYRPEGGGFIGLGIGPVLPLALELKNPSGCLRR